jgi:predicted N-formylglutamate amidohydrolase
MKDFCIVTCEHGGNRIPSRYRSLFEGRDELLATHRGYDAGALQLARDMARRLDAAYFASTTSRLLIDLNRSLLHPRLYSEVTRSASKSVQKEIRQRYYQPYRTKVEAQVAAAIARGERVIHLSCHSFTPVLNQKLRNADIGLLYDTARDEEGQLCRSWQRALKARVPDLKVRLNYPYAGTDDGFTTSLRRQFPGAHYIGIEVEVNQSHVKRGPRHWRALRDLIIDSLRGSMNAMRAQRQPSISRQPAPAFGPGT